MLAKKASSKCWVLVTGKRCRLGVVSETHLASPFSSKAGDGGPFAPAPVEPIKPLHRQSRSFSSGTANPPRKPPPSASAAAAAAAAPGTDYISLFQPSYGNALTGLGAFSPGSVLKVYPLPRYVLKEDLVRHLEVNKLQPENIKFVYGPTFRPDYVQFDVDSASTQKQITKRLQERGRLGCRFLRAEVSIPMHWSVVDAALKDSPRGRTIVMYNVNINTDHEDVERFFAGYNFDASYIRFVRVNNEQMANSRNNEQMANSRNNEQMANRNVRRPIGLHVAVGFTTRLEALRAMREKMGDFCANAAVNLRLIQ